MLDAYLIKTLKSLDENDCEEAIQILQEHLKFLQEHLKLLHSEDYYLTIPIAELPLSPRARNALLNNKIFIVRDLLIFGLDRIAMIRNIGSQTEVEIKGIVEKLMEKKTLIIGCLGTELKTILLS